MIYTQFRALALLVVSPLLVAAAKPKPNPCVDSGGQPWLVSPQDDTNLTEIATANGKTFPFLYCGAANDFPNDFPGTKTASIQVVFGVAAAGGFVDPILAQFAHPTDHNRTYYGNLTIPPYLGIDGPYNFEVLEVVTNDDGTNPGLVRKFVNVFV